MIQKYCPYCGGTAQVEDGIKVLCPYCGNELPADDGGVQMMAQPVPQEAYPEQGYAVQQPVQQNMQMQQGASFVQNQMYPPAQQYAPPQGGMTAQNPQYRQYTPEQLEQAKKKRAGWHLMNAAMFAMQGLILGLGIYLDDWGYDIGVPMILGWLASLFFGAVASAWLRPDEAYLEKKPPFGPKWLYFILHGLGHLIVTTIIGGILFGILDSLL